VGAGVAAVVVVAAVLVTGAADVIGAAATGAWLTGGLVVAGRGVGALAVDDVAVLCDEWRRCGFAPDLGAAGVRARVGTEVVAGARPEVTDNGSPASPTRVAAS
jgi:hypothetical protein